MYRDILLLAVCREPNIMYPLTVSPTHRQCLTFGCDIIIFFVPFSCFVSWAPRLSIYHQMPKRYISETHSLPTVKMRPIRSFIICFFVIFKFKYYFLSYFSALLFVFVSIGPVTVPMVSQSGSPPMPMPVQVPPGHVMQQIVDESGTLRHVILSTQHQQIHSQGGVQPHIHSHYVSTSPMKFIE